MEILQGIGDAIEHAGCATHAEEPQFMRRASAIHEAIDGTLESLMLVFEQILVLVMCLTLPKSNPKELEMI